ncbi:hypothetical protein Anas_11695 [Armadillidium nasatum]|uniref:Uncharacterized protein n=1 Tax=Armadillidium nasatum TaxID=96803 RepID=A0A5N5SR94_9CRUS|nr:hypothetical protein Anas_11695 [Armadillidium nasatum]
MENSTPYCVISYFVIPIWSFPDIQQNHLTCIFRSRFYIIVYISYFLNIQSITVALHYNYFNIIVKLNSISHCPGNIFIELDRMLRKEFNICRCFYKNNLFLKEYDLHCTYINSSQFRLQYHESNSDKISSAKYILQLKIDIICTAFKIYHNTVRDIKFLYFSVKSKKLIVLINKLIIIIKNRGFIFRLFLVYGQIITRILVLCDLTSVLNIQNFVPSLQIGNLKEKGSKPILTLKDKVPPFLVTVQVIVRSSRGLEKK